MVGAETLPLDEAAGGARASEPIKNEKRALRGGRIRYETDRCLHCELSHHAFVTGRFLLPELRRLKAGQSIREDGPTWHAGKSGTPTMGGLMFIFGILVTILVFGWDAMRAGSFAHLYVFAFAAVFGLIGFLDDFQKVEMPESRPDGDPKFALQLAAAVVFLCLMRYEGMLTPNLYFRLSTPMSFSTGSFI